VRRVLADSERVSGSTEFIFSGNMHATSTVDVKREYCSSREPHPLSEKPGVRGSVLKIPFTERFALFALNTFESSPCDQLCEYASDNSDFLPLSTWAEEYKLGAKRLPRVRSLKTVNVIVASVPTVPSRKQPGW
jgi:hypothetical protein